MPTLYPDLPPKRCPECGSTKPVSEFYPDASKYQGIGTYCKACKKAQQLARWHKRHPDAKKASQQPDPDAQRAKKNAYNRAYHAAHRDERRAYMRDLATRNAEERRASARLWRRDNRQRANATTRAWQEAHPDKVRAIRRKRHSKRRALLLGAPGLHWSQDVQAIYDAQHGSCAYCGHAVRFDAPQGAADKATVDHIVPLSRGGTNWPQNLAIACLRCNSSKGNALLSEWTDRPY